VTPKLAVGLVTTASLVAGLAALLGSPPSGLGLRLYLVVVVAVVLAALVAALDQAGGAGHRRRSARRRSSNWRSSWPVR
jgi:hypothetical protein